MEEFKGMKGWEVRRDLRFQISEGDRFAPHGGPYSQTLAGRMGAVRYSL